MIRAFGFAAAVFAAGPVLGLCTGADYLEQLSPQDLAGVEAAAEATPYGTGLIWRATRDGAEVALIGTVHIADPRLAALHARTAPLVAEADLLLVEAGPEEEAQMAAALTSEPERIFIVDGPTLPERLPPEVWAQLMEAAGARQIPSFLIAKMQPWYLSLTLAIPPCAMAELARGERGLDHLLMQTAEAEGVPVRALEDWDTLFQIMGEGTFEEQIEMLQLSLLPPEFQSAMFVGLLNAYFDEETALFWEASRHAALTVPGLEQAAAEALFAETEQEILIERNRNWIPRIEAASADAGRIVVAVGAAHLPGEMGVLRLLEAGGWTVERLN